MASKLLARSVRLAAAASLLAVPFMAAQAADQTPDCRSDPFYWEKLYNGEPMFGCVDPSRPEPAAVKPRGAEGPVRSMEPADPEKWERLQYDMNRVGATFTS